MYYEVMGWDKKTGAPTSNTYKKVRTGRVADDLAKKTFCPETGNR